MKEIDFRHDLLPLKDKIFRLALRITLRADEAEDITEETLVRAWEKRSELAQVNSLEAYCLTAAPALPRKRRQTSDLRFTVQMKWRIHHTA